MENPRKNTTFLAAAAFIIAALSAWYLWISQRYPFYFIWDMDLTTAIDTVLINSGLLPDHILHPGFGMYLALASSAKLAHHFAGLSILNLGDIASSLNPLVGMAELTDFIKIPMEPGSGLEDPRNPSRPALRDTG